MKTIKIIFFIIATLALASNVEACNEGTETTSLNPVPNTSITLDSASPNPSIGATVVGFTTMKPIIYSFYVVNVLGDTVFTMAMNQNVMPGHYTFTIPASALPPGTYIYKLSSGSAVLAKRFTITN